MSKSDADYLQDMLRLAEDALGLIHDRQRGDLDTDNALLYALQYCFMIIGEAATRVSEPTRDRLPSIPWDAIIGMRNWIVHRYQRVDFDVLWKTAHDDLPLLVQSILDFLPPEHT